MYLNVHQKFINHKWFSELIFHFTGLKKVWGFNKSSSVIKKKKIWYIGEEIASQNEKKKQWKQTTNKKLNRFCKKKTQLFFKKPQKKTEFVFFTYLVFFRISRYIKMQELNHHIMLRVLTNYFKPHKAAYQRAPYILNCWVLWRYCSAEILEFWYLCWSKV